MASEGGNFGHGWILPHDDLIETVSVRANHFINVLAPHEVADLATSINTVATGTRHGVPESDASISGPTT